MSSDIRQRIANLPPEKRTLLEQQILARLQAVKGSLSIPPRGSSGPVPLSFSQERLWFLAQLCPGQTAYNEASAYRLAGPLDRHALQFALDRVVERHEVLRTTYHSRGGVPVQVIGEPRPVPLPVFDLSDIPLGERTAEAQRSFRVVIDAPFDLGGDSIPTGAPTVRGASRALAGCCDCGG